MEKGSLEERNEKIEGKSGAEEERIMGKELLDFFDIIHFTLSSSSSLVFILFSCFRINLWLKWQFMVRGSFDIFNLFLRLRRFF